MSSRSTRRRILVDASVWIAYFRDPGAPIGSHAEELMERQEVFVAGPVAYEVLQGARTPREFERIRLKLEDLPYLVTSGTSWVEAAGMAAGLRQRGLTFPMTDILLATLARENHCRIWSLDPHFASIPGVRLFHPPKPRPHRHRA